MSIKKDAGLTADSKREGELALKRSPRGVGRLLTGKKKMLLKHKDLSSSFPDSHKSQTCTSICNSSPPTGRCEGVGWGVTGRGRPACKLIGFANLVYGFLCSLKLI